MADLPYSTDEDGSMHSNSPASLTPNSSEIWSGTRPQSTTGEVILAVKPCFPDIDVEKLVKSKPGLASQLRGRLYSGPEQSGVIQLVRKPHLSLAYKTQRAKSDRRNARQQASIIADAQLPGSQAAPTFMKSDLPPLPAIGEVHREEESKCKSAVDELYRLRSWLGWPTVPNQRGDENVAVPGKIPHGNILEKKDDKFAELMKRLGQSRATDGGEFVHCVLRWDARHDSVYNPYDLKVVSSAEARKTEISYTISASAVTQNLQSGESWMTPSLRWLWEREVFLKLRSMKLFYQFRLRKSFCGWQMAINMQKSQSLQVCMDRQLVTTDQIMQRATLAIQALLEQCSSSCSDAGFHAQVKNCTKDALELFYGKYGFTYTMEEFDTAQRHQLDQATSQLAELRLQIVSILSKACHEVAERENVTRVVHPSTQDFGKDLNVAMSDEKVTGKKATLKTAGPQKKLSYIEKIHCRRVLDHMFKFIKSIEYQIVEFLRRLVYKALESLLFHIIQGTATSVSAIDYDQLRLSQNDIPGNVIQEVKRLWLSESTHSVDRLLCDMPRLGTPFLLIHVELESLELCDSYASELMSDSGLSSEFILEPSARELISRIEDAIKDIVLTTSSFQSLVSDPELAVFVDRLFGKVKLSSSEQTVSLSSELGSNMIDVLTADSYYHQITKMIFKCVESAVDSVSVYCQNFHQYTAIVDSHLKFDVTQSLNQENIVPEDFEHILFTLSMELKQVKAMETSRHVSWVLLDATGFQSACLPHLEGVLNTVHQLLPQIAAERNDSVFVKVKDALKNLVAKPVTVADFVHSLAFLSQLDMDQSHLDKQYEFVCKLYDIAQKYQVHISPEENALYQSLKPAYAKYETAFKFAEMSRSDQIIIFSARLGGDVEELHHDLVRLKNDMQDSILLNVNTSLAVAEKKLAILNEQLKSLSYQAHLYATYHDKFVKVAMKNSRSREVDGETEEQIRSLNSELLDVNRDLNLLSHLWKSRQAWSKLSKEWISKLLDSDTVESLQEEIREIAQALYVLEKGLPRNSLLPSLSSKVYEFKEKVPVMVALCNPSLQERHWQRISDICGERLANGKGMTLEKLTEIGVFYHQDQLLEISQQASNEATLKRMLDKIEDTWTSVDFILLPYKDKKNVFIIGGTDDLQSMMDESLVTMITIRGSPFVTHIQNDVEDWNRRLNLFSHALDQWLICQRKWIYLESIFASSDIQRELETEYQMFKLVDKSWKEIMKMTSDRPNAIKAACVPGILEILQSNNSHLDRIQKSLEDYLEMKRNEFARLYFLSNEEILDILANAKNFKRIQGHIIKCFSNVHQLEFSDEFKVSPAVTSLVSAEGEKVPLPKHLRARGSVETWLKQVEGAMFATIKRSLGVALSDYKKSKSRQQWVLAHLGQVTQVASQVFWTDEVVKCLSSDDVHRLLSSLHVLWVSYVTDLAQLVHTPLEPWRREAVIALVTIDVHARDVIKLLLESGVHEIGDFDWVRQLRYTWVSDANGCDVCQASATLQYGYEYLGCAPRLVMTPLTDRCYLTLTGALQLHLGGSAVGPAGTGKTETVKDLAKSVGKHCMVFNCSDGLTYQMLGKFFCGMSQSGSWCCLDEFNRIDVEVLSVVAQQLQSIKSAKDQQVTTFLFEGKEIILDDSCGAFVTMNLGYAGRVELPDNVKSLFRPVSMTVPDSDMISEIILYSQGFTSAAVLSRKIVYLYHLAERQLSHQHHYDFGMRAIKLVLVIAGSYKRLSMSERSCHDKSEEEQEMMFLIKALRNANAPKLLADDAILFEQLISDVFPNIQHYPVQPSNVLKAAIDLILVHLSLQNSESLIQKCDQLYGTLRVCHGVMLVGLTGGGKTTARHVLAQSLNILLNDSLGHPATSKQQSPSSSQSFSSLRTSSKQSISERPKCELAVTKASVNVVTVNPKCVSLSELYGHLDSNTLEWTDGLLSHTARSFARRIAIVSSSPQTWNSRFMGSGVARQLSATTSLSRDSAQKSEDEGSNLLKTAMTEWKEFVESKPITFAYQYLPSISGLVESGELLSEEVASFVAADRDVAPYGWFWLVLDGPVDTSWVENLNTALDDSHVFCLANGERIPIGPGLRIVFEVDSLVNASPATVSRCGMVYMDPADLGWKPYVESWMNSLPNQLPASAREHLWGLFDHSIDKGLDFLHKHQSEQVLPTCSLGVITTLCKLLGSILSYMASNKGFAATFAEEQQQQQQPDVDRMPTFNYNLFFKSDANQMFDGGAIQRRSYISPQDFPMLLSKLFLFAFTWSFGGTLTDGGYGEDNDGLMNFLEGKSAESAVGLTYQGLLGGGPRAAFDVLVRDIFRNDIPVGIRFPSTLHSVFSYYVDMDTGNFVQWRDLLPKPYSIIEKSLSFGDSNMKQQLVKHNLLTEFNPMSETSGAQAFVPTVDAMRFAFLLNLLILCKQPVILSGDIGVGKSSLVAHALRLFQEGSSFVVSSVMGGLLGVAGLLPRSHDETQFKVESKSIHMSPFMTARQLQKQLEGCMLNLGKNVFGSPEGCQTVVFLDDLNVVQSDNFNAQPPLEVLRQLLDTGKMFDVNKLKWKNISNMNFIGTCGPVQNISPRFLRQFSVLNVCHPGSMTMKQMFQVILGSFLERERFVTEVKCGLFFIINTLICTYQYLVTSLKPSPTKPFCLFNMADLSKVVQGLQQATSATVGTEDEFVQLLCYEAERVFADRLSCPADKTIFFKSLADATRIHLKTTKAVEELRSSDCLYTDFGDPSVPINEQTYCLVRDKGKLVKALESCQARMSFFAGQMKTVVFFEETVKHVVRAKRILRQPRGHLIMVGVGGVGRQTVAQLACFISGFEYFAVTQTRNYTHTEFRGDMKRLYIEAGTKNKPTVLLLTDAHIIEKAVLEDISALLSTGEICDLFESDELEPVLTTIQPLAAAHGVHVQRTSLYSYFIATASKNIHVFLSLSPSHPQFAHRFHLFPALLRYCTMEWFCEWSSDALQAVAEATFSDVRMPHFQKLSSKVPATCVKIHNNVKETSQLFRENENRQCYATSANFISFLKVFVVVLKEKQNELMKKKLQMNTGLDQLSEASAMIARMQQELEAMKPIIEQKSVAANQLLAQLQQEQARLDLGRTDVKTEEARLAVEMQGHEISFEKAKKTLDEYLSRVKETATNLDTIDKSDLAELKGYSTPPGLVRSVMRCVCIILQENPDWPTARRLLGDSKFLEQLIEVDFEELPEQVLSSLSGQAMIMGFEEHSIEHASVACRPLYNWVMALERYGDSQKRVKEKRAECDAAEKEFSEVKAKLKEKQQFLCKVEAQLVELTQQTEESILERDELQEKCMQNKRHIERATVLMEALVGEQERWFNALIEINNKLDVIVGDCILSAACLNYYGPYTASYRQSMIKSWQESCHDLRTSPLYTFSGAMASDRHIQNWCSNGLPQDATSLENAILITTHHKWPLIVDPEGQAMKWLRAIESKSGLIVLNTAEPNYMRVLESSVQTGKPVLMEQVTNDIDVALEPFLLRNLVRRSGQIFLMLGDKEIDYNPNFRLYLFSKHASFHFSPELFNKVAVVNFVITFEGLEEQLLSEVVQIVKPALEREQSQLTSSLTQDRIHLYKLETKILKILQTAETNILDERELADTLQNSKQLAAELATRVTEREETQLKLMAARNQYLPVASRGAVLYFVIRNLSEINVMYQFSVSWFKNLCSCCIRDNIGEESNNSPSEASFSSDQQFNSVFSEESVSSSYLTRLINVLTQAVYHHTTQVLFFEHRLAFAFLTATSIMRHATSTTESKPASSISVDEWAVFLSGDMYGVGIKGTVQQLTSSSSTNRVSPHSPLKSLFPLSYSASEQRSDSQPVYEMLSKPEDLSWLSDANWCTFQQLGFALSAFIGLCDHLVANQQLWMEFFDCLHPYKFLSNAFDESGCDWPLQPLTSFQRLLLTKTLRQDALYDSVRDFILEELGEEYISTSVTNISDIAKHTNPNQPIIFILSPGCDPTSQLLSLSQTKFGDSKYLHLVSLGCGQRQTIKDLIHHVAASGTGWVFLQNCHLAPSWMPSLEQIVDSLASDGAVHSNFRLWLSSLPTETFPSSVLQVGNKITVEQPQGIRINIEQSLVLLRSGNVRWIPEQSKTSFAHLLFSLCFFHAALSDRKKYGSIGWNVPYVFSTADLEVAVQVLTDLVCTSESTPWKALRHITGDVVYGGRVTDDWDRRTLRCLLNCFYASETLSASCYMNCEDYPTISDIDSLVRLEEHARKTFPLLDRPEVCGMHPLANSIYADRLSRSLFDVILSMQPNVVSMTAQSKLDVALLDIATDALSNLPDSIVASDINRWYSIKGQSEGIRIAPSSERVRTKDTAKVVKNVSHLQHVLLQEVKNFNNLIQVVRDSLMSVIDALNGETLLSDDLEAVCTSLAINKVPAMWLKHSYPTQRRLGSWLNDLSERVDFFTYWMSCRETVEKPVTGVEKSESKVSPALSALKAVAISSSFASKGSALAHHSPGSYWLSAFFFPHGFLTAVLQCHARKHHLALSNLQFKHIVQAELPKTDNMPLEKKTVPPKDGVIIHGLHLQGAAWDAKKYTLFEPDHFQQCDFPQIHFLPEEVGHKVGHESLDESESGSYECPLYQSALRGQANFVTSVHLPTQQSKQLWVLRGAALLCQPDCD